MDNMNEFLKKNFNWFHIVGMVVGCGLSMIYWAKSGQHSDQILKSNPFLMALWGILTGYILMDLVVNARTRKDKDHDEA